MVTGSILIIFNNVMHLEITHLGVRQFLTSSTFLLCNPRGVIRVASTHL